MTAGPIGFIGTGRMGTPMAGHLLAGGQTHEPRVTGAAIRWFREAMAGMLASGDHVEVVKLIGYSEGGRS